MSKLCGGKALITNVFQVDENPFPSEVPFGSTLWNIFNSGYEGSAKASHFGWLDMVQLRSAISHNGTKHLIVHGLDTLGKAGNANGHIQICNAYNYNKEIIYHIPKEGIHECKPMYDSSYCRIVGGWDFIPNEIEDLPIQAKWFLRYLLFHTGVENVVYLDENISVTAFCKKYKQVDFITKKHT